jgi:hypothetical protein
MEWRLTDSHEFSLRTPNTGDFLRAKFGIQALSLKFGKSEFEKKVRMM